MYMKNRNENLQAYHYQANKDWFATQDTGYNALDAHISEIIEAYDEFIKDLCLEQLEAY